MKLIFCLFALLLIAGCLSFNNAEVMVVKNIPPKYKPVVEMKVGDFILKQNGEGTPGPRFIGDMQGNTALKNILSRWKSKGLIADYGPIGKLNTKPDYTLTINGYRNEDMPLIRGIISVLTLGLIPISITVQYNLNLQLQNNMNNKSYNIDVKDSFTVWQGIILLPALPFSLVGSSNMFSDLSMYSYSEFEKQGAFKEL